MTESLNDPPADGPAVSYLLDAVTYLDGTVSRLTLIKSVSFVFELIAAFIVLAHHTMVQFC